MGNAGFISSTVVSSAFWLNQLDGASDPGLADRAFLDKGLFAFLTRLMMRCLLSDEHLNGYR